VPLVLGALFVVELAERRPQRVVRFGSSVFVTVLGVFAAVRTLADSIDSLALIAIGFAALSYLGYRYGLVWFGLVDE
jgi:hypothetical protein